MQLNTDPGVETVVTITSSDPSRATVDKPVITFTAGTTGQELWNQAVTVKATFTHSVTSIGYAAAPAGVDVTVVDNAVATIVTDGLTAVDPQNAPQPDDPLFGITHTFTVPEGGTASYTMWLSAQPTSNTVVRFPVDSDLISLNTDKYTYKSSNFDRPRTIEITAGTDANSEDETVVITHTAEAGGGYGGQQFVLQVKIDDSGKPGLQLNKTGLTIGEGGSGTFTVRLNTEPDANVTVTPSVAPANDDVTFEPPTLTFTDQTWEATQTVTVRGREDEDAVDDVTGIALAVTGATGYAPDQNRTVSVTVDDNDSAGMTVSETSVTVREGAQNVAAFTVVLTAAPVGTVTVNITSSDDAKVDNPQALTFQTGDWDEPQTVSLNVDDEPATPVDTADTSATLTITTVATGQGNEAFNGLTASVAVAIEDDDQAGIQLSRTTQTVFEGTSVVMKDSSTQATWTVRLNTDPGGEVTVTISSRGTDDATLDKTTIKFASEADPNNSDVFRYDAVQTVTGVEDGNILNESVSFTHSITSGDYEAPDAVVTVAVTDNETATIIASTAAFTMDEGTTRSYTIVLSAEPNGNTVVRFPQTIDDLTLNTDKYTFKRKNFDEPRTIEVTAAHDDDGENDTVTIVHTADAGTGYDGQTVMVEITIEDDDKPGLMMGTGSATVTEGSTTSWTVRLNTKPTAYVTVTTGTLEGTGVNPRADAITVAPPTLTFTTDNWAQTQTVTVTGADDNDLVNNTAVATHLVTSTDTDYTGTELSRSVPVTVNDNDTASLVLDKNTVAVTETDVDVQATDAFVVKLSNQPAADVIVTVSSNNTDVEVTSQDQELTFTTTNWDDVQGVSLTIKPDDEGDNESATISLSAKGAEFEGKTAAVVVNIEDDDQPDITLSQQSFDLTEGANGSFTVVLNTEPDNNVVIKVSSSDAGAVTVDSSDTGTEPGASQDLTFTDANWSQTQAITVAAVDDDDDGDESVTISVSVQSGPYSVSGKSLTVTVNDNETGTMTLAPATLEVTEGETGTYTVVLGGGRPTGNVTVSINVPDTSVATTSHSSLTFTPQNYDTAQTVTVTGTHDTDSANEDAMNIGHTASGGGFDITTTPQNVAVTVTDDDTPRLVLDKTELTVNEGGTGTYTVRLNTQPTGTVQVAVTSAEVTHATVDKSSLTFTTENWNSAQTVTVTGTQDDADLDDESVVITNNASGADYGSVPNATVTVAVTDNDTATWMFEVVGQEAGVDEVTVDEGTEVMVKLKVNVASSVDLVFGISVVTSHRATTEDYRVDGLTNGEVTISSEQTEATITVTIATDNVNDDGESIHIVVSKAPEGVSKGSPDVVSININDTTAN